MKYVVEGLEACQGWTCGACNEPLVVDKVEITYIDSAFTIELPQCRKCGLVLVPESLALGKMQEVERILEDK